METVGDDIAWMKFGETGACTPSTPKPASSGRSGHLDGIEPAMLSIQKNTIFTNVALTDDGDVWWEGIGYDP